MSSSITKSFPSALFDFEAIVHSCCDTKTTEGNASLSSKIIHIVKKHLQTATENSELHILEKLKSYLQTIDTPSRKQIESAVHALFTSSKMNQFHCIKDDILILLKQFSQISLFSEKEALFKKIRELSSILRASSSELDKAIREQEITSLLDQIALTFSKSFLYITLTEQEVCPLLKEIIRWMHINNRPELPELIKNLIHNFLQTQSHKGLRSFLNDLHLLHAFPQNIKKELSSISQETPELLEKFILQHETEILENFEPKPPACFSDICANSTSPAGQLIFSLIPPETKGAFLQTSKTCQDIGHTCLQSSELEALRYLKSISLMSFSPSNVHPAFKKSIVCGMFLLQLDIKYYEQLDPDLQKDPKILQIVALSHSLDNRKEDAEVIIKKMPPEMQSKTHLLLEYAKRDDFPKTTLWALYTPFMITGSKYIIPFIELLPTDYPITLPEICPDTDLYFPDFLKKDPEYRNLMLELFGYKLFELDPSLAKDTEFFKAAVRVDGRILAYGDETQRATEEIALDAVRQNGDAYIHIAPSLKDNALIAMEAARSGTLDPKTCSETIANDPNIILKLLKKNLKPLDAPNILQRVSKNLLNNKNFMLKVLEINAYAIDYASEELKDDPDIILASIKMYPEAITLANGRLKNDHSFALSAVQKNGKILEYLYPEFQDDISIVTAAIHEYPFALKHASNRLKDNQEVVSIAIKNFNWTIMYASQRLQDLLRN